MGQFQVHRNTNPGTQSAVPYLLDVQCDLLNDLATRVVVPLFTESSMKDRILKTLTPVLEIEGRRVVMVTPQLAGVPRSSLGEVVADLSQRRDTFVAALDLLITGI